MFWGSEGLEGVGVEWRDACSSVRFDGVRALSEVSEVFYGSKSNRTSGSRALNEMVRCTFLCWERSLENGLDSRDDLTSPCEEFTSEGEGRHHEQERLAQVSVERHVGNFHVVRAPN